MKIIESAESWAATERLRFLEKLAWWRGVVNRRDLRQAFGISQPQATIDLQRFQQLNPSAVRYDLRRKHYESTDEMECVLHRPVLEEGLMLFLGDPGCGVFPWCLASRIADVKDETIRGRIDGVWVVGRNPDFRVERLLFLAVIRSASIRVSMQKVSNRVAVEKEIAPKAFLFDGVGWLARCWDLSERCYFDLPLCEVSSAKWPDEPYEPDVPDHTWDREETLNLVLHPSLRTDERESLIMRYGLKDGVLSLRVREAMRGRILEYLRVDTGSGAKAPCFLLR